MNRYPQYKHIELPWLSEIPEHWDIVRNKNVFSEIKDTVGEDSASYTLLSLTLKGIIPRDLESGKGKFPKDFDTYKIVKKGNMAFCLFDIDETPRTVGLSEYDGMLTGAYTILQVRNVNPRFSYYYYLALDNIKALRPLYSGLRKTINVGTFLGTKFLLPPRDEQDQIVRFLDWKVSEINRLINCRKRQTERLEELKKAVVYRAVTRGMNLDAKMKNSGVNWIGDIPEHWEILKLKRITSLSNEKTSQNNAIYVGMENVLSWKGSYNLNNQIKPESVCSMFYKGNILFGKLRPYLAKVIIADFDGMCSSEFLVLKNINCNTKYLLYYLLNKKFIDIVNSSTYGAKMPRANWNFIGNQLVTIPPIEEQNQIVAYLDEQVKKIESAISNKQKQIETFQELKTRLVFDVVTGKIDVRGIEISEYEYVEEEADEDSGAEDEEANEEADDNA